MRDRIADAITHFSGSLTFVPSTSFFGAVATKMIASRRGPMRPSDHARPDEKCDELEQLR